MKSKSDSRGTNIDVKNEDEKRKKVSKVIFEPSWADLGSSGVPSWDHFFEFGGGFTMVFEHSHFLTNKWSRGDLESILGRFGRPRGCKMEAAEGQKSS